MKNYIKITIFILLFIPHFLSCTNKELEDSCNDNKLVLKSKHYYPYSKLLKAEVYKCPADTNFEFIKTFYENGNIAAKAYYYYGKRNGYWTLYSENGKISFEGNFNSGKKDGYHKIFHDNGKIHIEEFYNDGVEVGQRLYMDSISGEIYKKEDYDNKINM